MRLGALGRGEVSASTVASRRPTSGALRLVVALLSLSACGGEEPPSRVPPAAERSPEPDPGGAGLLFTFDDVEADDGGLEIVHAASEQPFVGRVRSANGGGVEVTAGSQGGDTAVRFPPSCATDEGCPRAIIEVENSADLNPGAADFAFGATVLLPPDQVSTGSNVMQKGRFGSSGGQWKLQVDTLEGKPSCVVRDGVDVVTVWSGVTVADGSWHEVECSKDRSGVSISVDGRVSRKQASLDAVDTDHPIKIGGSGLADGDDRFHGSLDDVFMRVADST